jgi:hypothetical protein
MTPLEEFAADMRVGTETQKRLSQRTITEYVRVRKVDQDQPPLTLWDAKALRDRRLDGVSAATVHFEMRATSGGTRRSSLSCGPDA